MSITNFLSLSPWKKAVIITVSGVITALSMPPYNIWPLLFAGLTILYFLLSATQSYKRSFALIWLFFFGYFVAGLWWISNALLVEGNDFIWVWPLAVAGLPAILALFPAAICAFIPKALDLKTLSGFLGLVIALTLAEWLRGHLFSGFPWNLFGYSWAKMLPMVQIVSFGGIYFLTMLTIFWAFIPAWLVLASFPKKRKTLFLCLALLSFIAPYIYGYMRLGNTPSSFHEDVTIRLVQANIPQKEKWDRAFYRQNLQKYLLLSQADKEQENKDGTTIIIWPETALTSYDLEDVRTRQALKMMLETYQGNVFLFTGILRRVAEKNYFNSLALYDRGLTPVVTYDKSHLVPFGEYIPFKKWIPLSPVVNFTGFVPGAGAKVHNAKNIPNFIPLICYEIIFPGITPKAGGPMADWIINVTNDAWYGDSPGPYQHFTMAVYRAVEEGLPVIRATNTGISGVTDPLGRIIYETGLFESMGNNIPLPEKLNEQTIFSVYGDMALFIFLGLMTVIAFYLNLSTKNTTRIRL